MFKADSEFKKIEKSKSDDLSLNTDSIKCYLKALPLREKEDVDILKSEIESGNILVIRVTSLAEKSIDDVKRAIEELSDFVHSFGGDIARLGEERIVVTPPWVKIWRENI